MSAAYLIGVDLSTLQNQAFDTDALAAAAAQMTAQGDEANALVVATDINTNADALVVRLSTLGGQETLAAAGTDIENRAYDLVMNYNDVSGDSTLPGKVGALEREMDAWQQQAWNALRGAPAASTPAPPQPATPPSAAADTSGPADDGGFSGGGSAGPVDWGDGDSGEGGGEDDPMQDMENPDAGIDWNDGENSRDVMSPRSSDDGMPASRGESDPFADAAPVDDRLVAPVDDEFADMLPPPDEQTDEQVDETETEDVVGSYLNGIDVVIGETTIPSVGTTYDDRGTVLAVQTALKAHGFDPGALDGIYGPKTKKAINAMQSAAGIPQTGVIDYGVLVALKVSAAPPESPAPRAPRDIGTPFIPSAVPAATTDTKPVTFWTSPVWPGAPFNRWQGSVGAVGALALIGGVIAAVRR